MFTAPKFKIGDKVYTPYSVEEYEVIAFNPDNMGLYIYTIKNKNGGIMNTNESNIFLVENAVFVVTRDCVWEDGDDYNVMIVTKDYDKAKACFKREVEQEKNFEEENGYNWVMDGDLNEDYCFSAYEEGYYQSAHCNIRLIIKELC